MAEMELELRRLETLLHSVVNSSNNSSDHDLPALMAEGMACLAHLQHLHHVNQRCTDDVRSEMTTKMNSYNDKSASLNEKRCG
jgi:hypothetical protein